MDQDKRARDCAEMMFANDRASKSLGMSIDIPNPGVAVTSMELTDTMMNGFDVCHGGFIFSLADSAFAFACNAYDDVTLAAAASVEFLRPARVGDVLTATAREVSRGRRAGVYDVEVRNQDDKLVAVFRGRSAALGEPILDR